MVPQMLGYARQYSQELLLKQPNDRELIRPAVVEIAGVGLGRVYLREDHLLGFFPRGG